MGEWREMKTSETRELNTQSKKERKRERERERERESVCV